MKIANKDEKKAILEGLIRVFSQNRRWLLFFGTGTSCAMDRRFGMPALQEELSAKLAAEPEWARVDAELKAGKTLEQVLTNGLSQSTKARIQQVTGDFVAKIDLSVRDNVLFGRKPWVGETLLKAIVYRLPPRNPRLPVVTANYDMLIEYACAANRIRYTTGFLGNLIRVWDWEGVQDSLNQRRPGRKGSQFVVKTSPIRRVELFKVHGSVNRFATDSGNVECDLWTNNVPAGYKRVVAAPGEQKYEECFGNVDTVAQGKKAQDAADAFAVIGYGFNDLHLDGQIRARVQTQDCPLLAMTRHLDDAVITRLRTLGSRVWVLVAPKLANGESDASRTLVYMPEASDSYILDGERLWSCDSFAERILGG